MTINAGDSIRGRKGNTASTVPGSENTLRILKLLSSKKTPMLASKIAKELGLPRSRTYDLLGVMEENGFVQHLREDKRFGLGINALEVGFAYSHQEALSRAGSPLLARLSEATGESTHLAVLHGRDVLYLLEERAVGRSSLVTDVGVRLPCLLTASGRAILAATPRAQVRALYPDRRAFTSPEVTHSSIRGYSALSSHLDQVRQRGYATESHEVTAGFGSIAAAVKDHQGWPAAAVAVTYVVNDFPKLLLPQLAQMVTNAAQKLSHRIHGSNSTN